MWVFQSAFCLQNQERLQVGASGGLIVRNARLGLSVSEICTGHILSPTTGFTTILSYQVSRNLCLSAVQRVLALEVNKIRALRHIQADFATCVTMVTFEAHTHTHTAHTHEAHTYKAHTQSTHKAHTRHTQRTYIHTKHTQHTQSQSHLITLSHP